MEQVKQAKGKTLAAGRKPGSGRRTKDPAEKGLNVQTRIPQWQVDILGGYHAATKFIQAAVEKRAKQKQAFKKYFPDK